MFDTIIWATDGSETAAAALPYALKVASESGGRIVAAHVRELVVSKGGAYPVYADGPDLELRLHGVLDEIRRAGIDARYEQRTCMEGHVGRTLTEIASDAGADVIVVGSHGHTRLGYLFIGSVTQQLLRIGAYPVLAVPPVKAAQTQATAAAR